MRVSDPDNILRATLRPTDLLKMKMMSKTMETSALQYEFEVEVRADRAAVWAALTQEINRWWLPDFHMLGEGSVVTLDARAGGAFVEVLEDGGSLLWYQVQMSVPCESLHLVGHLGADWGGPATTMLSVTLVEGEDSTTLRVRDALYGNLGESTGETLESGWRRLFTEGLKAYVEGS